MAGATARVSFSSLEMQDVRGLTLSANVLPEPERESNKKSKRF